MAYDETLAERVRDRLAAEEPHHTPDPVRQHRRREQQPREWAAGEAQVEQQRADHGRRQPTGEEVVRRPPEVTRELVAGIAGARHIEYPKAGHGGPGKAFAEAACEFLAAS